MTADLQPDYDRVRAAHQAAAISAHEAAALLDRAWPLSAAARPAGPYPTSCERGCSSVWPGPSASWAPGRT